MAGPNLQSATKRILLLERRAEEDSYFIVDFLSYAANDAKIQTQEVFHPRNLHDRVKRACPRPWNTLKVIHR